MYMTVSSVPECDRGVLSASIINKMFCPSEVSTIPDYNEALGSLDNEILFSLVNFSPSTFV